MCNQHVIITLFSLDNYGDGKGTGMRTSDNLPEMPAYPRASPGTRIGRLAVHRSNTFIYSSRAVFSKSLSVSFVLYGVSPAASARNGKITALGSALGSKPSAKSRNPETATVSGFQNGGDGEIRTLDTLLRYTRFPIVRARPATRHLRIATRHTGV